MDSLNPVTAGFVIFLMGVALGFVIGFVIAEKRKGVASKRLTELVQPSMFDIANHFADVFGHYETEVVARNIIWICANNGNQWLSFSFGGYKDMCRHNVTNAEHYELDTLKSGGYLQEVGGNYQVTDKFIVRLWNFVRVENNP